MLVHPYHMQRRIKLLRHAWIQKLSQECDFYRNQIQNSLSEHVMTSKVSPAVARSPLASQNETRCQPKLLGWLPSPKLLR